MQLPQPQRLGILGPRRSRRSIDSRQDPRAPTPAVYIGAFDDIRELFAQSRTSPSNAASPPALSVSIPARDNANDAEARGSKKSKCNSSATFSSAAPECNGRRYRPHILEIKLTAPSGLLPAAEHGLSQASSPSPLNGERVGVRGGKFKNANPPADSALSFSIADLLDATVDEAIDFLSAFVDSKPAARAATSLKLLQEVGLGYLRLGQPINTLSGGESQRLKLVRHLADFAQAAAADIKPTLFVFDEPYSPASHFDDVVRILLQVFQRLVDAGHSVLIIEHNLDVIKSADWIIDLGPDAGDRGGQIVACGTPEQIAQSAQSHTGQALREVLDLAGKAKPA